MEKDIIEFTVLHTVTLRTLNLLLSPKRTFNETYDTMCQALWCFWNVFLTVPDHVSLILIAHILLSGVGGYVNELMVVMSMKLLVTYVKSKPCQTFWPFFFLISTVTERHGNYWRGESAAGLGNDLESGLKPYLPNALL